ncbi:Mitochondrial basic amino acids transporter [Trichoplax sp. H2]|nr:Mitochondrial basic amino acids transporter [Trichoplax sp. H2]|eukprot:RDD44895.1 Mitochondrial basic amino acids transporter [Trichoplax sp. H2]
MQSPLVGVTFINAIIFGTYGNILRRLPDDNSRSRFIAGSIAGTFQSGVACPMELVKTWMQLQSENDTNKLANGKKNASVKFRSSFHCLHHVYKTYGLKGCYRGMNLTVLREAIGCGTYFSSYDAICKAVLNEQIDPLYLTVSKMLFAGGMTGVISWLVTYPIDVLKTRIQADGLHTGVMEYSGLRDCFLKSYKNEGLYFLTRGLNSALLRAFPVNAATFTAVELFYRIIGSTEEDDEEY